MPRKELPTLDTAPHPWLPMTLAEACAMSGYKTINSVLAAIKKKEAGEPLTGADRATRLASLPWDKTGHHYTVLAVHVYRCLGIDPGTPPWSEEPWLKDKQKGPVIEQLESEWESLIKPRGRPNYPELERVHKHLKELYGGQRSCGRAHGRIWSFITLPEPADPREPFPCAILANGQPTSIEAAVDAQDREFEIIHLTKLEFARQLLEFSQAELDKAAVYGESAGGNETGGDAQGGKETL